MLTNQTCLEYFPSLTIFCFHQVLLVKFYKNWKEPNCLVANSLIIGNPSAFHSEGGFIHLCEIETKLVHAECGMDIKVTSNKYKFREGFSPSKSESEIRLMIYSTILCAIEMLWIFVVG